MFRLVFILLTFGNLIEHSYASSKSNSSNFRKGITTHQDWINRLKETYDYRIFKLLASRGGSVINSDQAKEACKWLQQYPNQMDTVLTQWRIIQKPSQFTDTSRKEWLAKYGDRSLVLPLVDDRHKDKARYLTLATTGSEKYAQLIAHYMEKVHDLYHSKFKTDEAIEGKFVIKLYPNRADFLKSGAPNFSFAYFRISTRELVGYVPKEKKWSEKQIADRLVHAFFHEGFHQFLRYYVPDPPMWIDEGFAEMFEGIQVRGTRLYEGRLINPNSLNRIKRIIKDNAHTSLSNFIYMDKYQYYVDSEIHYPQGWAVAHFFAKGSSSYQKYLRKVLTNLKNGMDRKEALDDVFGKVRWNNMEDAWKKYVFKLNSPSYKNIYRY